MLQFLGILSRLRPHESTKKKYHRVNVWATADRAPAQTFRVIPDKTAWRLDVFPRTYQECLRIPH